ncbi:protein rpi-1-like [Gossypium hirsutum]|uniref:Protein rpi-1-like n=1 Tax=Gossypium hirsutum TaxID=3635 RepID=A0ABM3BW79_GOSHI|nr:protein rpi-1-like [Gossypium hirsutum]
MELGFDMEDNPLGLRYCTHAGNLNVSIKMDSLDLGISTEISKNQRPSNTSVRGRPSRNLRNASQRATGDTAVRSKAKAPARAYAIRAYEEASSPEVITGSEEDEGNDNEEDEEEEEEDMEHDSQEEDDDDYEVVFQSQRSTQKGQVIHNPTRHAH